MQLIELVRRELENRAPRRRAKVDALGAGL
jgi:hypothetical protein